MVTKEDVIGSLESNFGVVAACQVLVNAPLKGGGHNPQRLQAEQVIRSMITRMTSGGFKGLTDKQASYAKSLIEQHFAGYIADVVNGQESPVPFVEQAAIAEEKAEKEAYAENPSWGMF